jgi:hypothetical protein
MHRMMKFALVVSLSGDGGLFCAVGYRHRGQSPSALIAEGRRGWALDQ